MFWNRQVGESIDIDDMFGLQVKKFQLKNRVKRACTDQTDYELRLKTFCTNNSNNLLLLTQVAGYRTYLIGNGCTNQQAAKETLEAFKD